MATGVLLTPPIIQFFTNAGLVAANGSVLTQVGGVNAATYQDVGLTTPLANPIPLNSRGEVSTVAGASSQCFLTPNTTYVFTLYDGPNATGNQLWQATYVNGIQIAITQSAVGAALWPRSAAEIAAGVTPSAFNYYYGYVQRYGAVGNGVTDDSTAFANAALVSGTHTMFITATSGGYLVNTPVVLPANASVQGYGRPLLLSTVAGSHIMSATSVATISIDGVRFQGLNSSTTPLSGFGGYAAANTGLVTCSICTDVRITNCEFSTFYNGVTAQQCTRLWINKCRVQHWTVSGIGAGVSSDFFIDDNDIVGCDQAGAVVAYGIQATGNQNGGFPSQFNSISNNRIANIPSWDAIGTHDIDGLRIIGNDCRNVRHGIDVGHLVNTNFVQNIVIANNYIEGTATDTWAGSPAEIAGIVISGFDATHRVAGCTITGNMIKNFFNVTGMVGAGSGAGCIAVNNADDVNVTGNIITNCATLSGGSVIPQSTGIYAVGTCNRLTISSNSLQGNTFNRSGIRASGLTADAVTISGNSGVYTTASTAHVSITTSTITNLNVSSNPTNSTAPYSEASTTTTNTSNAMLAGSGNTATAVSTGSTIPTAFGLVQCTVAGASTGNIMTAGIAPGQECVVLNESGSNSITMAVSGTSNVADGTSCVIAANTCKRFVWSAATSLWYHIA